MNVLESIARILKLEGVEWVSCYPSNELIEAVASEGIRTIMFRQERGAIMAADGFSRVNNRQEIRCGHYPGRPRCGEFHGRYRSGIR